MATDVIDRCPNGVAWCREHHTDTEDGSQTHLLTVDVELPWRPDVSDGVEVISTLVEVPGRPASPGVLLGLYWNDDGGDDTEIALQPDEAERIGLELVAAAQRCRAWSGQPG